MWMEFGNKWLAVSGRQCAERELERQQALRELVQSVELQFELAVPSEISINNLGFRSRLFSWI